MKPSKITSSKETTDSNSLVEPTRGIKIKEILNDGAQFAVNLSPNQGVSSQLPLSDNYILVDDYLPDHILIQSHTFAIGNDFTFADIPGKHIVILSNILYVNGKFKNQGKNLTVFCNELICGTDALIDISGLDGEVIPFPQTSNFEGDHPNGTDADNIDPNGQPYKINGQNAGICTLYFSKFTGQLQVVAKGGDGATGEEGGPAGNGRDGRDGDRDQNGGDGIPPGTNGNGAIGGNGGNGGLINLGTTVPLVEDASTPLSGEYKICYPQGHIRSQIIMGNGGTGGKGGNVPANGGRGGTGGLVEHTEEFYSDRHSGTKTSYGPDRRPNGRDYHEILSEPGRGGDAGSMGIIGHLKRDIVFKAIAADLPSSFLRIQILKAEYYYVNNAYKEAQNIYSWISGLINWSQRPLNETVNADNFSPYLEKEPYSLAKNQYDQANLCLNRLNLGSDFFGNLNNYVTLLDSEFINDRIKTLQPFFEQFETLKNAIVIQNATYQETRSSLTLQKVANRDKIEKLKTEINIESTVAFALNDEIILRQNQLSVKKNKLLEKEAAFKNAVEAANHGCSLLGALGAIGSVVGIIAGIASGIGAIGAAVLTMDDAFKIKNNFINNIDEVGPWIDPVKWKKVFAMGGDNNLVKQVDTLKGHLAGFDGDIKSLRDNFARGKGNSTLVAYVYDADHPTAESKKDFVDHMKSFLDQKDGSGNLRFPEAQTYQDEALAYIDFCEEVNRKRFEFTNHFLSIVSLTNQVSQLNLDNNLITNALTVDETTKVSSTIKAIVLDSYAKSLQFALKLIYLQKKSIDYFTLYPEPFNAQLYDKGIKGTYQTYLNGNQQTLINYLDNSNTGRSKEKNIDPIEIRKEQYPLLFEAFFTGTVNALTREKVHTIMFSIAPFKNLYLGPNAANWAEIYVTAVKLTLVGVKTNGGFVSINLQHSGISQFIRTDQTSVFFTHKPILKQCYYRIQDGNYASDFSQIVGDYVLNGQNPYVGVSPFTNWTLQIDENVPANKGLDLKNVESIELYFDFYYKPFQNYS